MYHQIGNIPVKVIKGANGVYKVFPLIQSIFSVFYGSGLTETEALWNAKNNICNSQALLNNVLSIENN